MNRLNPSGLLIMNSCKTIEDLTLAVNQMPPGCAPRINGLSVDFYKQLWNILGPDLHRVFLECYKTGSLPVSCQRAVLSLLPKKAGSELEACCALLYDYKGLSRDLTNRLKDTLHNFIHMGYLCLAGQLRTIFF